MKQRLRELAVDFQTVIINYFVTYIPCWAVRKALLVLSGMKIGKGSRILMGTQFQGVYRIEIGKHTYINSKCHLDGRGGLHIGDNVNISNYATIISASHDMKSDQFAYRKGPVSIEDYCWIGSRAIVLDRTVLRKGVVVSAGSVIKGDTTEEGVYIGVPAVLAKKRNLLGEYDVVWRPYFV